MMSDEFKKIFLSKYSSFGNEKFYKFLLTYANGRIENIQEIKGTTPEVELMDYHDRFLVLYRQENDEIYLNIAKIFRKAAHKIYYIMLKRNIVTKNSRFLNVV